MKHNIFLINLISIFFYFVQTGINSILPQSEWIISTRSSAFIYVLNGRTEHSFAHRLKWYCMLHIVEGYLKSFNVLRFRVDNNKCCHHHNALANWLASPTWITCAAISNTHAMEKKPRTLSPSRSHYLLFSFLFAITYLCCSHAIRVLFSFEYK